MNTSRVRTRFAPSPTGFIHLGNLRSALYPWAFARAKGGDFVLRIEDTDLERSSQEAVDVIVQSMAWLGITPDEGPLYQMQRMARYREVLAHMLENGSAYRCYMSREELDALRARQEAAHEKPRYDGTWRPEEGKTLPPIPEGVQPVLRFRNPKEGNVAWDDAVKGHIEFANSELDDLVIARPDGTPTYNFCVVVDDMDMKITHVIRGDDHVNNTPRQINIFRALGCEPPVYAHLPTVLDARGAKLSKRSGAKAVTQYRDEGYLPDALINYLARLGWSHGDDEIFSRAQFLQWFDLEHLGKSATRFDEKKLRWVNAQHMRALPDAELAALVQQQLKRRDIQTDARLPAICQLFKDRCETTVELAGWAAAYFADVTPDAAELAKHVNDTSKPAIATLREKLAALPEWTAPAIAEAFSQTLEQHQFKMPKLAMPVRLLALGAARAPSVDAVLALHTREAVLERLARAAAV